LESKIKINYYSYFKFSQMNANVKGMLWTASAVVVGILVAGLIKDKLIPTTTAE
jgi:Flp pilus assembly CpaF family ATPase